MSATRIVFVPVTLPSSSFTSTVFCVKALSGSVISTLSALLLSASTSEAAIQPNTASKMLAQRMNAAYMMPPMHPMRPSRRERMGIYARSASRGSSSASTGWGAVFFFFGSLSGFLSGRVVRTERAGFFFPGFALLGAGRLDASGFSSFSGFSGAAAFSGVSLESVSWVKPDPDAHYERVIYYNAADFVPVVACPSQVDNIHPVSEKAGVKVDEVFLGSCTNGRLEDLAVAARILKGKKIAPYVNMIVTPASRSIYREAIKAGYIETLAEAGAMITQPGCGLCCGRAGGILTDGETVLATNNRNFLGRMGTSGVNIYLGSPATAAMTALTGVITAEA